MGIPAGAVAGAPPAVGTPRAIRVPPGLVVEAPCLVAPLSVSLCARPRSPVLGHCCQMPPPGVGGR
eukprot:8617574-Pyramimonas_sp.AAC.1